MYLIMAALLAAGAADSPKTWWCPAAPDHQGFWLQCSSTQDDCDGLVKNTDQNFAVTLRPCVAKHEVWCLSYRPLGGGDHFLPAETYCHDTLEHCRADERDVMKFGKYKALKSCAKQ